MANLLPTKEQEKIKKEYHLRLLVLSFLIVLALSAWAAVLLFPSYLQSREWEAIQAGRLETLKNFTALLKEYDTAGIIKSANMEIGFILEKDRAALKINESISQVLNKQPAGVSLSGFAYQSPAGGAARLTISGVSGNREILQGFADSLKKVGLFSKVDLPISTLAPDRDISFSISIEGDF